MANRDPILRVAKWTARMQQEAISPLMQRKLASALASYSASAAASFVLEQDLKTLLTGITCHVGPAPGPGQYTPGQVGMFFAYAHRVQAIKARYTGASLAMELTAVHDQWVARGLDDTVLTQVEGVVS